MGGGFGYQQQQSNQSYQQNQWRQQQQQYQSRQNQAWRQQQYQYQHGFRGFHGHNPEEFMRWYRSHFEDIFKEFDDVRIIIGKPKKIDSFLTFIELMKCDSYSIHFSIYNFFFF